MPRAGEARARSAGMRFGQPPGTDRRTAAVAQQKLAYRATMSEVARLLNVSRATVRRQRRERQHKLPGR